MKQSINNSATKKAVKVHVTDGAAAAFSKDVPQMYARSECVVDSAFVNEVVDHLIGAIFSGIEAGMSLAQQRCKARDERAIWLRNTNLTAAQAEDILYVPEWKQRIQETVVKSEEVKPQETVETPMPETKDEPKSEEPKQPRRHHHGGQKHKRPVEHQQQATETVPPTVKRPTRSPMDNLNRLMSHDPLLATDLIAVLRKHEIDFNQIFND